MILYSIVPHELIYQTEESAYSNQKFVSYEGIPLLVEKAEDQQYRVVRVLSTDPAHYLDARCEPGAKILMP